MKLNRKVIVLLSVVLLIAIVIISITFLMKTKPEKNNVIDSETVSSLEAGAKGVIDGYDKIKKDTSDKIDNTNNIYVNNTDTSEYSKNTTDNIENTVEDDKGDFQKEDITNKEDKNSENTDKEIENNIKDSENTNESENITADITDTEQVSENISLGNIPDAGVPLGDTPAIDIFLEATAPGIQVKNNEQATIDYSNINDGYFMAVWTGDSSSKIKLQSKGPSGTTYTYNIKTDGTFDAFPISDGNGEYKVTVYKNVQGTKYSQVLTASFSVQMEDEMAPFIRPNQYVNYKQGSNTVKIAAEQCRGLSENLQKVEKVYNYVVDNITYDDNKAATVQSGYLPVLDDVISTKKGICFDYAALMTGMLRSQGVPCKLVVGYAGTAYHAWINVWSEKEGWVDSMIYFDGKDWKLMDPTFASNGHKSESIMKYIGNGKNYQAKYLY